ncbi:MAG TPA: RNA-binding S4 domain-containing protein [Stellaceae bacterium]|nr:RNA-binding S4 domain-containing protein [Stellaceae bacterium]
MSGNGHSASEKSSRRLDQWLWFARFAKSRSLAARLCAAGEVAVNGVAVAKPNHTVKSGDIVVVVQRGWERRVRVVALGERRGPATEARSLFEETAVARQALPQWEPLLFADDGDE